MMVDDFPQPEGNNSLSLIITRKTIVLILKTM